MRHNNPVTTTSERPPARPPQVRRATAVWFCVVTGIGTATIAALGLAAIDRHDRAPLGEWFSDFVKSPGLAGASAVVAASLALWGILTQVAVTKRGLEHQREVDSNRAWWDRFEWASARAVPRSSEEMPLPYEAVLSTLIKLTESAKDDVQRGAVGAITEVASRANRNAGSETEHEPDASHARAKLSLDLLTKYAEVAGNSPARSLAVTTQIYEHKVLEALERILPAGCVTTDIYYKNKSNQPPARPDAILEYKGKKILVEIKNYTSQKRLHPSALNTIHRFVEVTGADAVAIISPIELRLDWPDNSVSNVAAVWASREDDARLFAALNRVIK